MQKETTFLELATEIESIAKEMALIADEHNNMALSMLSSRLTGTKETLKRLLWVEIPELNDSDKLDNLFKCSTDLYFSQGIFEVDGMRQAFFKRQAKKFFMTEKEQADYIAYTENLYLATTKGWESIEENTEVEKQKSNIVNFPVIG